MWHKRRQLGYVDCCGLELYLLRVRICIDRKYETGKAWT